MNRLLPLAVCGTLLVAASCDKSRPQAKIDTPITRDLLFWLDAAQQTDSWSKRPLWRTDDGEPLDVWYDRSGAGRHLYQRAKGSQPKFVKPGEFAAVRFDGQDDSLGRVGLDLKTKEFTVVLFAAPRSNRGFFRGLLSANAVGENDFLSGFNIDLGPAASDDWSAVNSEGRGFEGALDLMKGSRPLGKFAALVVIGDEKSLRVYVDGQLQGERKREPYDMALDEITLGARCYSNSANPPYLSGFFDGDICEVMLFGRALKDEERQKIEANLAEKYLGIDERFEQPILATGKRLEIVKDPPLVKMLAPGFTVKELPVELTHINNLLYRPDGKLVALGYDGNIHLLTDTDGDGLEDKAVLFWDNQGRIRSAIGMDLTPPNYEHGQGVFVASKGKVSLIVDTDGDGRADKEQVLASGWPDRPHNVDTIGLAVDRRDNSIYFGVGTPNYANGYLLDSKGKAQFDPKDERGSIIRIAPDLKSREIFCNGVRFSVALRFNRSGDLFCTDQEGATWLPNGNPFDELLHLQKGRYYGFPPRHPKHLPDVIDEPSLVDFAPQHQSTCGLAFNEPVNGGPIFGPSWWADDAFIIGASRGKLYRNQLAKTDHGYIARTQLLACFNMMPIDVCLSPKGDLLVSAHSGEPDWGTGPNGKGKIFKISYSEPESPLPALAWANGPKELVIAFDKPLDVNYVQDMAKKIAVEHGEYVRPGDRFEGVRPVYDIVRRQMKTPRFDLAVRGVGLSPDRRTLLMTTDSMTQRHHMAISLADSTKQAADLLVEPSGAEATWRGDNGSWAGWMPTIDLAAAKQFTKGSAPHDELWRRCRSAGELRLRARLDLWQMLRPRVQPGSAIDFTYPEERVTLTFSSPGNSFTLIGPDGQERAATQGHVAFETTLEVTPKEGEWPPLEIRLTTKEGVDPLLEVTWHTNEDSRPRLLPGHRLLPPWIRPVDDKPNMDTTEERPELAGGSWLRGREIFFSDQALCSKCHQVGAQGGKIGPDLSNLIHRDYDSVLRDIDNPGVVINPDFVTYVVERKDGDPLLGTVRTEGEKLIVGLGAGVEQMIDKASVVSTKPQGVSVMPPKLNEALGPEKLRDLMTFLLTEPLQPAPLEAQGAPLPRKRGELAAILGESKPAPLDKPFSILLCAGPKDHGPGEHDYPLWQKRWRKLLPMVPQVTVDTAMDFPSREQLQKADVAVFFSANPGWNLRVAKDLDSFLASGKGLVYLHFAVNGGDTSNEFAERIGLAWKGGASKFRHGELDLDFPDPSHPITRGLPKLHFHDETYWQLLGDPGRVHLLATAEEEGAPRPILWTMEHGPGRVFVSILGHYSWTFDDPIFRVIVLRAIAWAGQRTTDALQDLVEIGARVE